METLLLATAGGASRALVGIVKTFMARKPLNSPAMLLLLVTTTGLGTVLAALIMQTMALSPFLAFIVGYASFDVLDASHSLVKIGPISIKKKSVFTEALQYK